MNVGLDSEVGLAALSADEKKVVLIWDSAFQTYLSELEKTLEDWVIRWKQDLFQTVKNEDNYQHLIKILDQIVPKMVAIVELKIHLQYNALPAVQSTFPFFTCFWYRDLTKSIADCNDGIKIVCFFLFEIYILITFTNVISQLYSFYNSFIYYLMSKTNIKKDDTQSYNMQKAPVLFENWLIYHYIHEKTILHIVLSNKKLSHQSSEWRWSNTENMPKRTHFQCLKAEGGEWNRCRT